MGSADRFKTTLTALEVETSERGAKDVLRSARDEMGMVPNMYRNMANAPELLDAYVRGYAGFRNHSGFTSAEQEVIFLTISAENECGYCVAAHSMMADRAAGVPEDVVNAIRNGDAIKDARLRALHATTLDLIRQRGYPTRAVVDRFLAAGFEERQLLYLVLALAVKLLSNYSNHIFETPIDEAFAGCRWVPPGRTAPASGN